MIFHFLAIIKILRDVTENENEGGKVFYFYQILFKLIFFNKSILWLLLVWYQYGMVEKIIFFNI